MKTMTPEQMDAIAAKLAAGDANAEQEILAAAIVRQHATHLRERESAKPVAYCDPRDLEEDHVGMCAASASHLSINSRYTMPLYANPIAETAKAAVTDEIVYAAWEAHITSRGWHAYHYEEQQKEQQLGMMRAALEAVMGEECR